MKAWIDKCIKENGYVQFNIPNGAIFQPESYIGDGWYIGYLQDEEVTFHESEVVPYQPKSTHTSEI